nr:unnamed protein product [Callosobruchus analis]
MKDVTYLRLTSRLTTIVAQCFQMVYA